MLTIRSNNPMYPLWLPKRCLVSDTVIVFGAIFGGECLNIKPDGELVTGYTTIRTYFCPIDPKLGAISRINFVAKKKASKTVIVIFLGTTVSDPHND
jgi:hypothetical protein